MITCIHNSGYVKSDSDDSGETPNTPEKFYFPRVSVLILHSQGQITTAAFPSLSPLTQPLEPSLSAHKSHQLSAGTCTGTNWFLLGSCVCISINACTDANFYIIFRNTKHEHLGTCKLCKTQQITHCFHLCCLACQNSQCWG